MVEITTELFAKGATRLSALVEHEHLERDSVHKTKSVSGFSNKYGLDRLIYFEEHADILGAIERDKQIKSWLREKKLVLIESLNPKMAAFEHSLEPPREPADFGQIASR